MAIPEIAMSQTPAAHRIGPNAITRVAEVLREDYPEPEVERLFALADIAGYLAEPPQKMVDEREVTRLHGGPAHRIGRGDRLAAGPRRGGCEPATTFWRTGFPLASRSSCPGYPPGWPAGCCSAPSSVTPGPSPGAACWGVRKAFPPRLSIAGCCICHGAQSPMPLCDFYAAAIERLFQKARQTPRPGDRNHLPGHGGRGLHLRGALVASAPRTPSLVNGASVGKKP
jgi:divinyl protochlorophyllide a 8-vinyl-reductase